MNFQTLWLLNGNLLTVDSWPFISLELLELTFINKKVTILNFFYGVSGKRKSHSSDEDSGLLHRKKKLYNNTAEAKVRGHHLPKFNILSRK